MRHEDLEVWKKSVSVVTEIYKITETFPNSELYGLTSQIRRSAVSIPSNIAEGCARFSDKETVKFLSIATGSVAELQTQLLIAKNLGYDVQVENLVDELEIIKRMILKLSKYLKSKETENP